MKTQPVGVCDLCLGVIPPDQWYTSRGTPRLHCCLDCKNTANSRAGAPVRSAKTRLAIGLGQWTNPASIRQPDPEKVSIGVSRARKAEVKAGAWRNPALDPAAREKLSKPRRHTGDLAKAIEKLRHGKMADLTEAEHAAWLEYRRDLYRQHQAEMTIEQHEQQRERWRKYYRKTSQKNS